MLRTRDEVSYLRLPCVTCLLFPTERSGLYAFTLSSYSGCLGINLRIYDTRDACLRVYTRVQEARTQTGNNNFRPVTCKLAFSTAGRGAGRRDLAIKEAVGGPDRH